ncbi:alpha/beta hydrolase [Limibacter armeniacum]|uniref:alpha/beta fold hydrolase n=1 Tax=Limibacter armeniacum TaxID=466084 RepID=UPI002FE543CA
MYRWWKYQGHRIAYLDNGGKGETIIFLHGMGSNSLAWQYAIAELEDFRCIALDLPGYGKSEWIPTDDLFGCYRSLLKDFILQTGLRKVTLAGHSMGGQLALLAAFDLPEKVERLILSAPAGLETFTAQESEMLKAAFSVENVCNWDVEEVQQHTLKNFYFASSEAVQKVVEERIARMQKDGYVEFCKAVSYAVKGMLEHPVATMLPKLSIPVLLFFGKQDGYIPNTLLHPSLTTALLVEKTAETISNCQFKMIDQCGHFPHLEHPEVFCKALEEWMAVTA